MEKPESQKVLVTIDAEKYRTLRHKLIDRRETFNGLVNRLIDQHLSSSRRIKDGGERSIKDCGV